MTQLTELDLSYTQATDAGLKELTGLTQLGTLNLSGTQVRASRLNSELARMTQLTLLYLYITDVADIGVAGLQAALPSCEIYF